MNMRSSLIVGVVATGALLGPVARAQPAGPAWRPWDDADWRGRGQEIGVTVAPTSIPAAAPPPLAPAPLAPRPIDTAIAIQSPTSPVQAPVVVEAPPAPITPSATPSVAIAAEQAPATPKVAAATSSTSRIGQPPPGKSQVVFYRESWLGAALSFTVHDEIGHGVAKLGAGTYVVASLEPGVHTFMIKGETTDTLRLELDADETYYVQQSMGIGIVMARPRLALSDETSFDKYPKLRLSTKKPTDAD
jgi:hypothetical protein